MNAVRKIEKGQRGEMMEGCEICMHEGKYHAILERHEAKTSHCTFNLCDCKEFKGKREIKQEEEETIIEELQEKVKDNDKEEEISDDN